MSAKYDPVFADLGRLAGDDLNRQQAGYQPVATQPVATLDIEERLRRLERQHAPILIYDFSIDARRLATQADVDDMQSRLRELGEVKDRLREIAKLLRMDCSS